MVHGWIIDLKCDVSAEVYEKRGAEVYEKRGQGLDEIWPKMSPNRGLDSRKTIGFLELEFFQLC